MSSQKNQGSKGRCFPQLASSNWATPPPPSHTAKVTSPGEGENTGWASTTKPSSETYQTQSKDPPRASFGGSERGKRTKCPQFHPQLFAPRWNPGLISMVCTCCIALFPHHVAERCSPRLQRVFPVVATPHHKQNTPSNQFRQTWKPTVFNIPWLGTTQSKKLHQGPNAQTAGQNIISHNFYLELTGK